MRLHWLNVYAKLPALVKLLTYRLFLGIGFL